MRKLDEILKIASVETGVPVEDIKGKNRSSDYVFARWVFFYLARETGYSFPTIGRVVAKDHTTVIHAYEKAKTNENIIAIAKRRLTGIEGKDLVIHMNRVKAHGRFAHVYERYGGKCYVCGFDEVVEVHHIIPKAVGGNDVIENLILLCPNHHALADRGALEIKDIHPK